ncbi:MAG: hypothetical protein FE78DRAFT_33540 [Acidomyces sp. 'richmondensis']|nr:MAG: hypothetical protein FE78DRAFT_33540 [Acidomyces sp. 'richmondensis']
MALASRITLPQPKAPLTVLNLPPEILLHILEFAFADNREIFLYKNINQRGGIISVGCPSLAFSCTPFVASSLFVANNIPQRLSILHPKQIQAVRSLTLVADARHFRKLVDSGIHLFGIENLNLDRLTVVFHRSSFWHYLFDFTSPLVLLLRNLEGVRCLTFARDQARVKRHFKMWSNRLIGLLMKIDHLERYMKHPPNPERAWWTWHYDDLGQTFSFEFTPAKEWVDEQTYMLQILPFLEEWKVSVEQEEWNPDPRSRNGA